MKAIIFNSGLGHRMGDETKTHHKSMTLLKNGETIFHRQLRLLIAEGVTDFIITTGPFADQLQAETADFPEANFTFVPNDIYMKTNYIYSCTLPASTWTMICSSSTAIWCSIASWLMT